MTEVAQKDQNAVSSIIGVSSTDGKTIVKIYADPATHRLLVNSDATSVEWGNIIGSIANQSDLVATYIPYTGANTDVNIGNNLLIISQLTTNDLDQTITSTASLDMTGYNLTAGQVTGTSIDSPVVTNSLDTGLALYQTDNGKVSIFSTASGKSAIFDISSIASTNKTFTFPNASGTFALQSGASGSFTTADLKTVTVVNGIITSIA